MTAETKSRDTNSWIPAQLYKKPYLGLMAVGTLLSWQAFGHAFTIMQRTYLSETGIFAMNIILGILGLVCVWRGFEKDELTATCYGALGGALIWFGFFEYGFNHILPDILGGIPPLMGYDPNIGEFVYYNGGMKLLQASGLLAFPIIILLGLNKDTRCRFFKWFHRNFKLKPEAPTAGYRRQYSRITAMEYVFVTWFIYVVCLTMLDPRLFDPAGIAMPLIFLTYCVWCVYLIYKLTQQSGPAPTVRYAVGAGISIWLVPESLSGMQMMTEYWLKPFEYPILNSLIVLYMVVSAYILANAPDRGAKPKKKKVQDSQSTHAAQVAAAE